MVPRRAISLKTIVTIGFIVSADEAMGMNLRDLEYALAVAEHGHFSRAADACAVGQPTLSGQIRKLEAELGVELFERDGRTIRVTEVGRTILEHARTAVDAAREIARAAHAGRDPLAGTMRVGIIPTLGPYLLPHLLPAIRTGLPSLDLALVEEPTARLVAGVLAGDLEAAIVATAHESDGLAEIHLFDEALRVALPAHHALAEHDEVSLSDLDPEELLLLTDGHCLRGQALALCEAAPRAGTGRDLRASSLETLLNLVEAGYGMTIIPVLADHASRLAASGIVTRPFTAPGPVRTIRLIHRRSSARAAALRSLAAAARTCVSNVVRRA
jgi:LysR family hydrogen peroxide-inducible transcriptional activator